VKDFADEVTKVTDDLALMNLAEEMPAIVNPYEEEARLYECEHCGHQPCGCGG